jgi:DTW domain-containing protein YfiP
MSRRQQPSMPFSPLDPPPEAAPSSASGQDVDLPLIDDDESFPTLPCLGESECDLPPTFPTPTRGRQVCGRCRRPSNVCICAALPSEPVRLRSCHCVVLQHPKELERKNRSLPFLQLSLHPSSLTTIINRRLDAHSCPPHLDYLLSVDKRREDPASIRSSVNRNHRCWLIFPSPDAVSLTQALRDLDQGVNGDCDAAPPVCTAAAPGSTDPAETVNDNEPGSSPSMQPNLTVMFLDATWQLAREMFRGQAWDGFRLVQLDADDFAEILERPCRYPMRTPPTPRHLSTHECISYVLSRIEHCHRQNHHPAMYQRLLQPLDLAVQQYQRFLMRSDDQDR